MPAGEGDTAQPRVAPYVLVPPEEAAAQALAAYLRTARLYVWAGTPALGETSRRREIAFAQVLDDWPDPTVELEYPSASVTGSGTGEHLGGFTPSPIECTWDRPAGSVVWQVGWMRGELQVDLWADSKAMRNALAAQMAGLFNPRESMSGLLLYGPETYACAPIRYLLTTAASVDTQDTVYANERRFSMRVAYDVPLLDLRAARPLQATVRVDVDPTE